MYDNWMDRVVDAVLSKVSRTHGTGARSWIVALDRLMQSKGVLMVLLSFSIFVPLMVIVLPQYDIAARSFSSVGYENPVWFGVWGISTGLGTFFGYRAVANNVARDSMYSRDSIKPGIRRYLMCIMAFASVCVVVLAFVYERDSGYLAEFGSFVHLLAAQLFGVLGVGSIVGLFAISINHYRHHIVFVLVIGVTAMFSFVSIIIFGHMTAERQFVAMLPTLAILMLSVATGDRQWIVPECVSDELGIGV
jgi:hypothetical protein